MINLHGSKRAFACAVLAAIATTLAPGSASADGDKPREIIIEPEPLTKVPPKLTPMEQRAVDNALAAGAVETLSPVRHRSQEGRLEKDISVDGSRCYYISVVTNTAARVNITYAFGQTPDGRPITEGGNVGNFWSVPGGQGVARFCADHSGTVHITVGDDMVDAEHESRYVMVVGSRPETPEQLDARHRLAEAHDQLPQN